MNMKRTSTLIAAVLVFALILSGCWFKTDIGGAGTTGDPTLPGNTGGSEQEDITTGVGGDGEEIDVLPTDAPATIPPTEAPTTPPTEAPTDAPVTIPPTQAPTTPPTNAPETAPPTGKPTTPPTEPPEDEEDFEGGIELPAIPG